MPSGRETGEGGCPLATVDGVAAVVHEKGAPWGPPQMEATARRRAAALRSWARSQDPGTSGLEVISQYFTDIKSEDTFATDSNGRLMISRKRNYRPTWKLNLTEPVSSNVTL